MRQLVINVNDTVRDLTLMELYSAQPSTRTWGERRVPLDILLLNNKKTSEKGDGFRFARCGMMLKVRYRKYFE